MTQIPKNLKYPKILLTGGTGQMGWELQRTLYSLGKIWAPTREEFDFSSPESLRRKIRNYRPNLIVNSAAYTAVDQAESEPELARAVNVAAPRVLAEEAVKLRIPLIHYSTDYVFDGEKNEPYTEVDAPNPLNVYGETKFAGERAIQESCDQHMILRTSWVYSNRSKNFLTTMLRLFQEREEICVVNDQVGAPTSATMLAEATAKILKQVKPEDEGRWGLYHLTAAGQTSWYGFTQEILQRAKANAQLGAKLKTKKIQPITTAEYLAPAKRPMNSRLDCSKTLRNFEVELEDWARRFNVEHATAPCG